MQNLTDIDRALRFAIVREIGERLRVCLREEPELTASPRTQLGFANWKISPR